MQKIFWINPILKRLRMNSNWEIKKLGEVCNFFNGKAHEKVIDESGNYIVVNSKFISRDGKIKKYTKEQKFPLFRNDIVMVMSDVPNGKALAKCCLIDNDDKYSLNQRICAIRSEKFNYKYLYYQLNRHKHLLSFNNGKNQTNLRKNDILETPLQIPPLPEQKRIVAILDKAFSAIEKAKQNAETNLKNAKEIFESFLQNIFENKGDNWVEKKLGEVLQKTETVNPRLKPEEKFIYLDVSSVNKKTKQIEKITTLLGQDAPSRARKLVKTNDVIFATVRPTHSRVSIISDEFNNQVCSTGYYVLRPKDFLNSKFIYYFLLTFGFNEQMKKLQKGASYPAVTNKEVESRIIPFPKLLEEQKQIVKKLDALSAEIQKIEMIYQKNIEDLEELKKSILQKAFRGEL